MDGSGEDVCPCEEISHGILGPVKSSELLGRLVTSPNHINKKTGKIKPGLFPLSHIRELGVSLMRIEYMSESFIQEMAYAIAGQKVNEKPLGLLLQTCQAIREIVMDDDSRALCVIDDPAEAEKNVPENEAHAIAVSAILRNDEDILEIQHALSDVFGWDIRPLGNVRS